MAENELTPETFTHEPGEVEVTALYEVAYRWGRRGLQVAELFHREADLDAPRFGITRPRAWPVAGSLAAEADRLWEEAALLPGNQGQRFLERLNLLRQLVAQRPVPDEDMERLASLLKNRTQWLPVLPGETKKGVLLLRWVVWRRRTEPYPLTAVFLSLNHGLVAGYLRSCSRCGAVALTDGGGSLCDLCAWAFRHMPGTWRSVWNHVYDRMRKGTHPAVKGLSQEDRKRVVREALRELYKQWQNKQPITTWKSRWERLDPRKGGRGHKRPMK